MKKILIIENNEKIRKRHSRLLKAKGYGVLVAQDSYEAYKLLINANKTDLILLDSSMPNLGEDNFFNLLKMFFGEIKIMVSNDRPWDEQISRFNDAADYYDTSQGPEVLLEKIEKILG